MGAQRAPRGFAGVFPTRLRPGRSGLQSNNHGGSTAVLLLARRRVYSAVSPLDDNARFTLCLCANG